MEPEPGGLGADGHRVSGALGTAWPAEQTCRRERPGHAPRSTRGTERGPQVTRHGWSWKPREGCLRQGLNASSALGDVVQGQGPGPAEETGDTVGGERRKMSRKSHANCRDRFRPHAGHMLGSGGAAPSPLHGVQWGWKREQGNDSVVSWSGHQLPPRTAGL